MPTRTQRTPEQKLADALDKVAKYKKAITEQSRRADAHRKITLGGLVIAAGASDLDPAVIVGLLLKGMEHVAQDRENFRRVQEHGIAHLAAREQARQN